MRQTKITPTDDGVTIEVFPSEHCMLQSFILIIVGIMIWALLSGIYYIRQPDFDPLVFAFVSVWTVSLCAIAIWRTSKGILSVHGSKFFLEYVVDRLPLRWSRSFDLDQIQHIKLVRLGKHGHPTLAFEYKSKKYGFYGRGIQEAQVKEIIDALRIAIDHPQITILSTSSSETSSSLRS